MSNFYNADNTKPPYLGTVFINQLKYNPKLQRISAKCEGCGQIHSYHIHKKIHITSNFPGFKFFSRKKRFYISCPKCTFAMELEYDEFLELMKIANQNKEEGRA